MDRLIAADTVPFGSHDIAPTMGTPGMGREANPVLGFPGTDFPAYAWNMLSEEQRNAVIAAGITPDSANWFQLAQAIATIGKRSAVFSSPGTFAFIVPAGVYFIFAQVYGGGGGSGGTYNANSASLGGGGGGYTEGLFPVTPGSTIPITVGAGGFAGGVSGSTPSAGGQGGASSVGTFCSATGGDGGYANTNVSAATVVANGGFGVGGSNPKAGGSSDAPYAIPGGLATSRGGNAAGAGGSGAHCGATGSSAVGGPGIFPGGGASGSAAQANGAVGGGGQVIVRY